MSEWSTLACLPLYQSFDPTNRQGLARLLELLVFTRGGTIELSTLVDILLELNDGIEPFENDYYTFVKKSCKNIKFKLVEGRVKCVFARG